MAIKQRLLTIKQQTKISTQQLALAAGLSIGEVYLVEIGGFVSLDQARKVVNAFSQLSGQQLTVDDIRIQNIPASPIAPTERWLS